MGGNRTLSNLKYLFEPIKVGNMRVKNRVVMPPMGINFGIDDEGHITDQLCEYFSVRAKGGAGMIIVGGGGISPRGLDLPKLPPLWDDKWLPGLRKLVDAVHRYDGIKIGMQLIHGGRQQSRPTSEGRQAPSPIPALAVVSKEIPEELDLDGIKDVEASFADCARRCRSAGFDFVEIHAAHGYLISEFMSPNANKRKDQYGGTFENRSRFLLEVFDAIRQRTAPDYPIGVRYNGQDGVADGWTVEESLQLAPILESRGAAYLHISGGIYGTLPPYPITIASMYTPQACFLEEATAVKKVVSIPVITTGRIKDPYLANRIVKEGKADMVSMGRSQIADPDIVNKMSNGRVGDIRPCIGCCLGCINNVFKMEEASCVMNPEVNREYLLKDKPGKAPVSKKVLIIGAGPAGLAAAWRAATRGHRVIICEERNYLGGMLRLASVPPGRREFMELIEYYQRELENRNVEIRLNVSLNEALIDEIAPDVAVIATGSIGEIPQIQRLFDSGIGVHSFDEILEKKVTVGDRILIIGGNMIGFQISDYLASELGKEVVILHRGMHYAEEMAANDRAVLVHRLIQRDVKFYKNVSIKNFTENGVVFDLKGREIVLDGFDDIVLAEGRRSKRSPVDLFKNKDIDVHVTGDAKSPRTLLESQAEADEVGRSI